MLSAAEYTELFFPEHSEQSLLNFGRSFQRLGDSSQRQRGGKFERIAVDSGRNGTEADRPDSEPDSMLDAASVATGKRLRLAGVSSPPDRSDRMEYVAVGQLVPTGDHDFARFGPAAVHAL